MYAGLQLNGTVYDYGDSYYVPIVEWPEIPSHTINQTSKVQVFLSTYFLESAASAITSASPLVFLIPSSTIPEDSDYALTTSMIDVFLPFLQSTYGKQKPVDLNVTLQDIRNFTIKQIDNRIEAIADINLDCIVHYKNGTQVNAGAIQLQDVELTFSIKNNGLILSIDLKRIEVKNMYV